MQIKSITVNAAGMMAAEKGNQGNGAPCVNQVKTQGSSMFGPACKVTISREGKNLSSRPAAQNGTVVQDVKEERKLLRQQEEAELIKAIREGYRENLNEIEKQISEYNTSYAGYDRKKVGYDSMLMNETIEEQEKLRTTMQNQKQFQAEENQRRAKEARQMAAQCAQYKGEIDENNRDLYTLLQTMKETEKAEDEQENDGAAKDRSTSGTSASDMTTNDGNGAADLSMGDVIKSLAAQFMSSSIDRERVVQEMFGGLEESGRWFLDTADSITQSVLQRISGIRAALDDESFSDEQIAEMMQNLQDGMAQNYDNVRNFRSFGLQVMSDVKKDRLQHIEDTPLKNVQQTKRSMMLSAADAALGEARQSSLDKASQELAEEVRELIDQRNEVEGVPQNDREEVREEQTEEAEQMEEREEEQADTAGEIK